MRANLLEFLFGESAPDTHSNLGESVIALFEEADNVEADQIVADKKPLAAALKALDIDCEGLTAEDQCCEITCSCEEAYKELVSKLSDADAMHKLAELGWVASRCGDQAMSNEPPSFKVKFLELNMLPTPDNAQKTDSLETIIDKARENDTTAMDRDNDDLNPVETDILPSDDGRKGVGKAEDGKNPTGTIKDSLSVEQLMREYLDEDGVNEATMCSGIPPVASPVGVPARSRFKRIKKKAKSGAQP